MSFILPASDITSNGASETFGFLFQDFTDPSTGNLVTNGNFSVVAQATYTQSPYDAFGPSLPSAPPSSSRSTTRRRPRSATSA